MSESHEKTGKVDDAPADFWYVIANGHGVLKLHYVSDGDDVTIDDDDIILIREVEEKKIIEVTFSAPEALITWRMSGLPPEFLKKHPIVRELPQQLKIPPNVNGESNVHVIVSTGSGTGRANSYFERILKEYFRIVGFESDKYMLHTTDSEHDITDLTKRVFLPRAMKGTEQTILLLTGDGGIVDMINVLLSAHLISTYVKPVIGLFALGTGNALANSTGLNEGYSKGLAPFLRGTPRNLPTFTVHFSPGSEVLVDEGRKAIPLSSGDGEGVIYGAVVCSWALHASLVADSDTTEYRKHGSERFQIVAKDLLHPSDGSASHRYRGKVTLFRRTPSGNETRHVLEEREHIYILATLVSNLERTFRISPHSKPLDGQLRLLRFGVMSSEEVMRILGLAFSGGRHVEDGSVGYEEIEGLRIEFDEEDARWRRVCVDGKIVRVGEKGWVEVRREKRDVIDIVANG